MAKESDPSSESLGNPLDIALIRQLVGLMRENELSEISLQWEDAKIRLRRGGERPIVAMAPAAHETVAAPPRLAEARAEAAPAVDAKPATYIRSPTVGTFYAASSPESDPFVKVGAKVLPDTVVCMIEAMKVYNEIPAQLTGTIVEVLVENGAPVEYNTPLFRVE